jgi:ABC-type multidrug transport system fused ATPase/permease subunit
VRGEIEFQRSVFAYPDRPPALNGVSLHIRAGETVALTGPNGAGKSTLAHLLMRLMAPTSGRILIDGIDIATVTLASLRSQIGVVPQHVLLFNGSVFDNIAYGLPQATPRRLSLRRAQPRHTSSSQDCRMATKVSSATRASACPAASASALPWPARC